MQISRLQARERAGMRGACGCGIASARCGAAGKFSQARTRGKIPGGETGCCGTLAAHERVAKNDEISEPVLPLPRAMRKNKSGIRQRWGGAVSSSFVT